MRASLNVERVEVVQPLSPGIASRLAEMGMPGFRGVVGAIDEASPFGCRLREMGVREGEELEWVSGEDPVLLKCGGSRLAVCREMLAAIFVCRCRHNAAIAEKADPMCGGWRRFACDVIGWFRPGLPK